MRDKLLQNYKDIISEVSNKTKNRSLLEKNIDLWDIIAAAFLASFTTISLFGISWVAYYVVISLSSSVIFTSGTGIGISFADWLKDKDNRIFAVNKVKLFLNSNFADEIKNTSGEFVKTMHSEIKQKLIELFDNKVENFEQMIKQN
jgi:amino acid transporter